MDKYFVIHVTEDGEISIRKQTKQNLLEMLEENDHGPNVILDNIVESDPMYWGDRRTLIIKGEIVVPYEEIVVTKYDIE